MLIILIALLVIAGLLIKKPQMTWKQSILKAAYPIIMFVGKLTGQSKNILLNRKMLAELAITNMEAFKKVISEASQ